MYFVQRFHIFCVFPNIIVLEPSRDQKATLCQRASQWVSKWLRKTRADKQTDRQTDISSFIFCIDVTGGYYVFWALDSTQRHIFRGGGWQNGRPRGIMYLKTVHYIRLLVILVPNIEPNQWVPLEYRWAYFCCYGKQHIGYLKWKSSITFCLGQQSNSNQRQSLNNIICFNNFIMSQVEIMYFGPGPHVLWHSEGPSWQNGQWWST